MPRAYYNENDPFAAQWLRNLMAAGLIMAGDVDERSIDDVSPGDLSGYVRCHFFAGIAGWDLALRLSGWPQDRPVWTGSCPCQPFSAAGKGKAADDERHLWPAWFSLIREFHPATIFGEQVEAAIGWGWLDAVFADLESEGYACASAVLPACAVGARHIRNRLWFVADANGGDSVSEGLQRSRQQRQQQENGHAVFVADTRHKQSRRPANPGQEEGRRSFGDPSGCRVWDNAEWLPCSDGNARAVKSGIFPLAYGIPARMGKLRAAGNAIVPQLAAEFILSSYF